MPYIEETIVVRWWAECSVVEIESTNKTKTE